MIINKEGNVKSKKAFNDHAFFEDQKPKRKGKCLAEISELRKFSPPYNFLQVTLDLDLFLVSMLLQK